MNSYSLRRSPEKSARARELTNVNKSQKSGAPAAPRNRPSATPGHQLQQQSPQSIPSPPPTGGPRQLEEDEDEDTNSLYSEGDASGDVGSN